MMDRLELLLVLAIELIRLISQIIEHW